MMIWRMLLSILLTSTLILSRTITSATSSLKLFQLLDILSVEFPLSLKKKKLFFLVMPFLKKQLGDGTFLQVITTSYFLAFKINFSLFLTTIVFFQATDGTQLSVTKKSLTHIFHKKKSPSLLFSFWQSWAF